MKPSIRLLALSLCLITFQAGANLAHAGKGSGGGNNDDAFALQKVMAENPGLSETEVLLQAFNESEGRLPPMNYKPVFSGPESMKVTREYAKFLPSYSEFNNYIIADSLGYKGPNPEGNYIAEREVTYTGPLLGNQRVSPVYLQSNGMFGLLLVEQVPNKKGLLFKSRYSARTSIEFRQFNSKIVIYVIHPDSVGVCHFFKDGKPVHSTTPVCAVGYVWADPDKQK